MFLINAPLYDIAIWLGTFIFEFSSEFSICLLKNYFSIDFVCIITKVNDDKSFDSWTSILISSQLHTLWLVYLMYSSRAFNFHSSSLMKFVQYLVHASLRNHKINKHVSDCHISQLVHVLSIDWTCRNLLQNLGKYRLLSIMYIYEMICD